MSYPVLMYYFKTLEYFALKCLGWFLVVAVYHTNMLGEIAFLKIFHRNIQSLGFLEPSQELHK